MATRSEEQPAKAVSDRTQERHKDPARGEDESLHTLKRTRNPDVRAPKESGKCISIADAGGQGFIELPDGTYHAIGPVGVLTVSEAELQRQVREKGFAEMSQEKIAELRVFGMVSPAERE